MYVVCTGAHLTLDLDFGWCEDTEHIHKLYFQNVRQTLKTTKHPIAHTIVSTKKYKKIPMSASCVYRDMYVHVNTARKEKPFIPRGRT